MGYITEKCNSNDKVLIIDDIFDSGITIKTLIEKLKTKLRKNYPAELKVATVFYKKEKNISGIGNL
jgi:hypoxanthine phosphoribosyltransferase